MRNAFFSTLSAAAVAGALAAPASADNTQLAASAGLPPAAAATLSLDRIAAIKFNNETAADNHQTVPTSAGGGEGITVSGRGQEDSSLSIAAARHFNNSTSGDNRQTEAKPVPGGPNDRTQLTAAAGLRAGPAEALTLDELAAAFFARSSD